MDAGDPACINEERYVDSSSLELNECDGTTTKHTAAKRNNSLLNDIVRFMLLGQSFVQVKVVAIQLCSSQSWHVLARTLNLTSHIRRTRLESTPSRGRSGWWAGDWGLLGTGDWAWGWHGADAIAIGCAIGNRAAWLCKADFSRGRCGNENKIEKCRAMKKIPQNSSGVNGISPLIVFTQNNSIRYHTTCTCLHFSNVNTMERVLLHGQCFVQ